MPVPRLRRQELMAILNEPDTVIIDVRRQQKEADRKIKNAVLEDPEGVSAWAENYPMGKTLVLYCS